MNFKHIWIVFKKEMVDALRDRKSVVSNILLPLVLIPLMYFAMNMVFKSTNEQIENDMKIAIVASSENQEKIESFTKENIIGQDKMEIVKFSLPEDAKNALNEGEINCIIKYQDGFLSQIEKGSASGITIEYNSLKNSSQMGMQLLQTKLMGLNQSLATQKLAQINVSPEILNLVQASTTDVSLEKTESGKSGNQMLMMIIPMYLVIIIVTAGVPIAIDVLAGERERNTFEALLSTKANRLSILIGKYMSILVFSIIAILMSFIGLILGMVLNPEMFSDGSTVMSISTIFASMNMPLGAFLLAILSAITLTIAFAGIQIAISTLSKSVKEAQTYLSYMMFPAMLLGFATMFMGAGDIELYMGLIPIFNTIVSLKMVLAGVIDYNILFIGVITNIVFVGIVTAFIIKLFNNEKVIIK